MTQHLQARGRWRIMVIQMHVVHMNTRYQSIGEARGHPDGLAVLALLLTDQDSDNAQPSVVPEERVRARGLREPGVHLPAGLAAAGRLWPLALLPLRGVADHAVLRARGALDSLRGHGSHRARSGGPVPDRGPGQGPPAPAPHLSWRTYGRSSLSVYAGL
ncbi:uncharacterized protein LOC115804098 isoform X2 [Delphinapterus leucas]|uniref:Uncharacterized protein LOC115804098 isoform X2 n=1 Tax=Delphinapterus leucas TaxID=9749 RepID=A0A7F8KBK0_DELLE|nr:uncharacterized protein LOC115804098 isoform X2 [Delphinapterus leucas]